MKAYSKVTKNSPKKIENIIEGKVCLFSVWFAGKRKATSISIQKLAFFYITSNILALV